MENKKTTGSVIIFCGLICIAAGAFVYFTANKIYPDSASSRVQDLNWLLDMFGVTERGEILTSKDGFNWNIKNYNKEYAGYQKSCLFKEVIAANNRIVIIGMHDDNSPAVLISTLGNVWTERSLVYDDNQGIMKFLTNEPNSITYDSARDQFILACDKGEIFTLPSCSKCNESAIISDSDLYAIICTGNLLICVGQEFSVNIVNL